MKYTQNQVKESIMFFAEQFGLSNSYKALIDSGLTLPELVRMMVYEMFLQKFNSYGCDDISYISNLFKSCRIFEKFIIRCMGRFKTHTRGLYHTRLKRRNGLCLQKT